MAMSHDDAFDLFVNLQGLHVRPEASHVEGVLYSKNLFKII